MVSYTRFWNGMLYKLGLMVSCEQIWYAYIIKMMVETRNNLIVFYFSFAFGETNREMWKGDDESAKKVSLIPPDQFDKSQSLLYHLDQCCLNIWMLFWDKSLGQINEIQPLPPPSLICCHSG